MKNRFRIIASLIVINVILLIPSVIAYMIKQDKVDNQLIPAEVSCLVEEEYLPVEVKEDGKTKIKYYETTKTSIKVRNTSNIPVYIRVKLANYFEDSKGNTVARSRELDLSDLNLNVPDENGGKWIHDTSKNTYYYTLPIQPNSSTTDLLKKDEDGVLELKTFSETFNGVTFTYHQVVEVHAEAIQYLPDDAIESSWGVFIKESTGELSLTDNGD